MKNVETAIEIIDKAKDFIKKEFDGAINQPLFLHVEAKMTSISNYLRGNIGMPLVDNKGKASNISLGYVTEISGEKIPVHKPLLKEDLQPEDKDKEFVKSTIEFLYDDIDNVTIEKVSDILKQPFGEVIIRGLAKKAKHNNYQGAAIDVVFLDELKICIAEQKQFKAESEKLKSDVDAESESIIEKIIDVTKRINALHNQNLDQKAIDVMIGNFRRHKKEYLEVAYIQAEEAYKGLLDDIENAAPAPAPTPKAEIVPKTNPNPTPAVKAEKKPSKRR